MSAVSRSPWGLAMGAMTVVYGIALLVVSSNFMTTDAAKYVGIGRNVLAGKGAVTVFDRFFPFHSPTWPVIVMAPEVLFGVEWTVWSHVLQVTFAVAVLLMTGLLASRAGPRSALLAVAIFAAFPYGFELARDVGLDEAAAASTLAFVVIALRSPFHSATRWGVVAGVAFGFAFLIKEIVLPFAPLPLLVLLLAGRSWRVALRLLGTFAGVGFAVASWWFILYAVETGKVYRVGTPAWTLLPITFAVVALLVLGFLIGREPRAEARDHAPDASHGSRRRHALIWLGAVGWAALLAAFFQLSRDDVGNTLLAPSQYVHYLRTWAGQLVPIVVVGLIGSAFAVWQRARGRIGLDLAAHIDGLVIALIIGLPLIMVVVGVGDPPRHYIAQLSILTALGAIGGVLALDAAGRQSARRFGGAHRAATLIPAIALVTAVAISGALMTRTAIRDLRAVDLRDQTLATAINEVGGWLATTVGPDDTVALGSTLSYEIGTTLPASVRVRVVREEQQVLPRPTYPLGVGRSSGPPNDDWVVLTWDRHDTDSFYGYSTAATLQRLRDVSADVWIEGGAALPGVGIPIIAALEDATGISPVRSWTWPYRNGTELRLTAYAVDTSSLGWTNENLYLDETTLERLLSGLEKDPAQGAGAAATLAGRVRLVDGAHPDLIDRLKRLAASG